MIHRTKGIVLRTVRYGETSVVVTILTELFGVQSYLINGVRTSGKNSTAHFYQPSSLLEMQVYHNELKNLQRVKETRWSVLYKNVLSDVFRNAVAMYMIELLYKCVKQPEQNTDLFNFVEDAFIALDNADDKVMANFPLFFSIQLAHFFGFRMSDDHSELRGVFDMQEGSFVEEPPAHPHYMDGKYVSQLLKAMQPSDLSEIRMNRETRRELLGAMEVYYGLHVPDFGVMKTLGVLREVLG